MNGEGFAYAHWMPSHRWRRGDGKSLKWALWRWLQAHSAFNQWRAQQRNGDDNG